MRLVDSSAWIEWLIDSPTGRLLAPELPQRNQCLVPTIIQLELSKWLTREKSEGDADRFIAFTRTCVVITLDTSIALRAATLCMEYRLATADAVIYASAIEHEADVLTCDSHFEDLPNVVLLSNRPIA
jgi:predicted nucleic acid-binding protein